jgi:L,D-peptidoglycan transpeptidase YkuD (ErfK/YbiS/YcfS/YnhG family)
LNSREMSNGSVARRRPLVIRALSARATQGFLELGGRKFPCALGRSGLAASKREGDGATPIGRWRLLSVLYRSDHGPRPLTGLPVNAIGRDDGWCDAPSDRNYNRRVSMPYLASAETMWRPDGLYDVVVVLSHNVRPRVRGAGSAIFIHVARPGFRPTEGCIAMRAEDLRQVLACCRRGATIDIR